MEVSVLLLYFLLFSISRISTALDSISPNQSLRDGDFLVSAGQIFELGFFNLSDSKSRYLGLWYKNISPRTIVWVANRDHPLSDSLGMLNVTSNGNLVLVNSTNDVVWSSNTTTTVKEPVGQILQSGNFVVRDGNDSNLANIFWQSFDHPGDTLLPGMKLGGNLVTGLNRFLSSWKGTEDPAPGLFSLQMQLNGYPQLLLKKGNKVEFRPGSWNGVSFSGNADVLKPNPSFTYEFVLNKEEIYYTIHTQNNLVISRFTIDPSGIPQLLTWDDQTHEWTIFNAAVLDQCENYALCGAYSNCNIKKSSVCECLDGFTPKSPKDWDSQVWSDGCVPKTPLKCKDKSGFLKIESSKLPDTSSCWFDEKTDLKECERLCLLNCSCTAYANLDIRDGGSGCLLWFDKLIDMREITEGMQDLYVRLAASELDKIEKKGMPQSLKSGTIAGSVILGLVLLLLFCMWMKNLRKKHGIANKRYEDRGDDYITEGGKQDVEFQMFNMVTISEATNSFSSSNKLGQGGFGPVYKGTLVEGQEIAVKRLSRSSGQGMNEFKNEVTLIAKLQHRNLVKLLGCCIHGDEKMLIYEYMPNKSLDYFIFDQTRSKLLDWNKRVHIISGIARGLLYLHQDSRLKIIHRDLKLSNILLDSNMNPKISDFGLARTFGADQTQANTGRIVGTYGYMSPEYAIDGLFSTKSDVFSFGVLLLEILTGKKNRGFCHPDHDLNLLGHNPAICLKQ
ncbi:G-type lectin S-receptor-like serine/threonine-protein kinase At4g27290 isoform X2 [Manihot esculenta]|uniref:Uncharacterized protein n=2 Tax=Manihot esculenta TaxID=3983 RepID=A0ACB7GL41_MANES|nr:G-type lectin S-receptor-like serine/threonine-protein kinase At4g27290 isoform X2 [Manihot esculenta]KAG8640665.1 hypothetical protein MANES_13G074100v8 [Manihot esculenta]KAG8640670.1 hypothetical protein MANES_13G074100v8 [Manihot esculenta]